MKGQIKVVGQLDGWPFEVKTDATTVNAKSSTSLNDALRMLKQAVGK